MLTEKEYDRVSEKLRRIVKGTKSKPVTRKDWKWVDSLGPYIEYECSPGIRFNQNCTDYVYTRKSTPGTRKDALEKWGPKPFLATVNTKNPTLMMLIFKDDEYAHIWQFEGTKKGGGKSL